MTCLRRHNVYRLNRFYFSGTSFPVVLELIPGYFIATGLSEHDPPGSGGLFPSRTLRLPRKPNQGLLYITCVYWYWLRKAFLRRLKTYDDKMHIYIYWYSYKGSVNILIHDPIHKKRTMIYVNKLSENLLQTDHSSALFRSSTQTDCSSMSPIKNGVAKDDSRDPSSDSRYSALSDVSH